MTREPRAWVRRAWIVALPIAALAARGHLLGEKNLWWDEALAIWAVRKPLVETTLWTAGDVHPPLFFWMLWGWVRLVGQSEFAVRYLAAMIGVVGAVLALALARRIGGWWAGALALTFASLARFEVWWSTELRMYVLAGAAVALAVYAGTRWMLLDGRGVGQATRAPRGRRAGGLRPRASGELAWLALYVIAATAALYTVYLAAVAVAVTAVAGAASAVVRRPPGGHSTPSRRRRLWRWLAAQALVLALVLPWMALALPRMQSWTAQRGEPMSLAFVSRLWATLIATGVSTDVHRWTWWGVLFWSCVAIVPAALWLALRRARGAGASSASRAAALVLLASTAVVAPLAVWGATQPRSLFYSPSVEARYFVPFAVPAYALAGVGAAYTLRRSRVLGLGAAAAALAVLVATLPGHYADRRLRDEMQSMVLAIWSQAEKGDAVLLTSGNRYPLFLYHYGRPWDAERGDRPYSWPDRRSPRWEDRPPVVPFPNRGSAVVSDVDWQDMLSGLAEEHPRLWLAEVDAHLQDPGGDVEAWLDAHLPKVLSEAFGPNALHLYAADGAPPRVTGVSSRWPGVVVVEAPPAPGYAPVVGLPARRLAPGDPLALTVWRVDREHGAPRDARLAVWGDPAKAAPYLASHGPVASEGSATQRARVVVEVDDRTPSGMHEARLELAGDGSRVAGVEVLGTSPALPPGRRVNADFGLARLREAAVSATAVRPGDVLVLDLLWETASIGTVGWAGAGAAPGASIDRADSGPVVFAHLVGPARPDTLDPTWSVQDGLPSSGAWPRRPGEQVFDRHVLAIDPAAPAGLYTVEVGLYDPVTLVRHPVRGSDADEVERRVTVARVRVRD